jgi:hypothetical protein
MDAREIEGLGRRNFLKYSGLTLGAALTGLRPRPALAARQFGDSLVQQIDHVKLYMTHYAFFEEPDPGVPNAVYFDAATGQPTNELFLSTPVSLRDFRRGTPNRTALTAPSETSKLLPYVVEPPGFPAQAPPAPVVGFIQQVTGLPGSVIVPNTSVLLVAIGQFLSAGITNGRLAGGMFSVDKTVIFEVRIRIGFLFRPPVGVQAPGVGLLTGYLNFGFLHQLIQLPPPADPGEIVVYRWITPMTLSTNNSFIRATATEPPPVAEAFPDGMTELRFEGSHVDNDGRYTIVGSAQHVHFDAPPELLLFLFGSSAPLLDVEFAVEESGVLV